VANSVYITRLKAAIFRETGSKPEHVETVPVTETFQGRTVWEGDVEVFSIPDHPKAKTCFAWSYDDGPKTIFKIVLAIPPITTPLDAVRAAVVAQLKQDANN